jgi:hypothetical protein
MQLVNAAGHPRDLKGTLSGIVSNEEIATQVSRWEYAYDAHQGLVAYEVFLDRHGQRLQSTIYPPSEAGQLQSREAYTIGKDGSLAPEKGSCAAFLTYDYSPDGYERQIRYLDQAGNPTPGKDGAFIKRREYDSVGHLTRGFSLWKDGRPMNDDDGNAEARDSYDQSGNQISEEYFDAGGKPIDSKRTGFQRFTCKYDDRGNCAIPIWWHADSSRFLDIPGQSLCESEKFNYDNRGNLLDLVCLMPDGLPAGSGWAFDHIKYDEADRPIEDMYFDHDEHPAPGPVGFFRDEMTHDADGNITEFAMFGEGGKPFVILGEAAKLFGIEGFHSIISKFENGHEVRTEYRDGDGKLVAINAGYAAIERKFDAHGNEIRTAYLGLDGHPVLNRKEDFAIKNTSFDA